MQVHMGEQLRFVINCVLLYGVVAAVLRSAVCA